MLFGEDRPLAKTKNHLLHTSSLTCPPPSQVSKSSLTNSTTFSPHPLFPSFFLSFLFIPSIYLSIFPSIYLSFWVKQNRGLCADQGEQLPERGQGVQPERRVQEVPLGLHQPVHHARLHRRGVQQAQVPQGAAPVLRQGARQAQLRHALLLVPGRGQRGLQRTPPPDHRAHLLVRGPGDA